MELMKNKTKPKAKEKKKDLPNTNGLFVMSKPSGAELEVNPESVEHALAIGWKYQ
jgi:hypothetical protein